MKEINIYLNEEEINDLLKGALIIKHQLANTPVQEDIELRIMLSEYTF